MAIALGYNRLQSAHSNVLVNLMARLYLAAKPT